MEELRNDELLFDDRELDELSDETIEISLEEKQKLNDEVEKYFKENKIEYED